VILAAAVLFNIARMWEDEILDDEGSDDEGSDDEGSDEDEGGDDEREHIVVEDHAPATVRMRGQIARDQVKDAMPN
jgi:hypothetical protein